jgi:hypothetical protein
MTSRAAITLLAANIVAALGAVALFMFISSRTMPDNGTTPERIDIAAARLAAQPNQSSIAELLHRDDSYIRALLQIIQAQRTVLCWSAIAFVFIAVVNVVYVLPVVRQSNRNA